MKKLSGIVLQSWQDASILAVLTILILSSYISEKIYDKPADNKTFFPTDSTKSKIQLLIDSLYSDIFNYNDLVFQGDDLRYQKENLKVHEKNVEDTLVKLNDFNLQGICSKLNDKESEKKIKDELKGVYKDILWAETERQKTKKIIVEIDSTTKIIDTEASKKEKKYKTDRDIITEVALGLQGAGILKVNKITYRYFIAQKNEHNVRVHNNTKKNGQSINDVMKLLNKEQAEPLMVSNGGMYTPEYGPQGLLIENFKEAKRLDTTKPKNENNLNFYLQPNGVFYVDSSGLFYVEQTDDYKTKFVSASKRPRFATQSGPMLVTNRSINKQFKIRSTNTNIRNGVGLINHEKIVFIISDIPVNLFDFALVFRDIFSCSNALYLDGAISSMYLNDKIFGIKNNSDRTESYGPVISVTINNSPK